MLKKSTLQLWPYRSWKPTTCRGCWITCATMDLFLVSKNSLPEFYRNMLQQELWAVSATSWRHCLLLKSGGQAACQQGDAFKQALKGLKSALKGPYNALESALQGPRSEKNTLTNASQGPLKSPKMPLRCPYKCLKMH